VKPPSARQHAWPEAPHVVLPLLLPPLLLLLLLPPLPGQVPALLYQ
jgi:hypothetical protein